MIIDELLLLLLLLYYRYSLYELNKFVLLI